MNLLTANLETRVAIPLPAPISAEAWATARRKKKKPELEILEEASGLAATVAADPDVAAFALRRAALFEKCSRESLDALISTVRLGELSAGDFLCREGEPAEGFYVVVDGTLEVLRQRAGRQIPLRHESTGGIVGLFGLLNGAHREASVRAISDVTVLEVRAESLKRVLQGEAALSDRLEALHQERILENFMTVSGLFRDVDAVARARLMARFVRRTWAPGAVLVSPGEVGHALAVVLSGSLHLDLPARPGGKSQRLVLERGQFLAVTSALIGRPTRVRVATAEPSALAVLKHREMAEVMRDYTALRTLPTRLREAARAIDSDVFCGNV